MLTKCSECGRDVSDKAAACPNCGAPISSSKPDDATTIEQTSKEMKAKQFGGCLIMIVGLLAFAAGGAGRIIGGIALGIGLLIYIFGRAGAWWHHG